MEMNFNSVETIPNLNASAAFQVDSGKVFKKDTDIVPDIVDDTLSYVPWGGVNALPYNILEHIVSDKTLFSIYFMGLVQVFEFFGKMWKNTLKTPGKMWDFSQKYLEKCEKI
jgi:hypothetical protein